jgi:hypothetical protein
MFSSELSQSFQRKVDGAARSYAACLVTSDWV